MLSELRFFVRIGVFISAGSLLAWSAGLPSHVPGRLLAAPRAGLDDGLLERTLKLHMAVARKPQLRTAITILDVPEEASEAILQSLLRTGLFAYVERDPYASTAGFPNDPGFVSEWYLPRIQAPQAWSVTTGSPAVVVAVIDTGVNAAHADLAGRLLPGWNFVHADADTSDVLGHGTAVAGAIAADGNNGIGVAGVSWGSRILPLVVVDENNRAAYSDIAAAIQYAADHGVRVINLSVGGPVQSSALQSAVDYAWSKGAVLVAAAMNNSSSDPSYPAACNHVLAVSATDSNDRLADFSNFGSWIALAAPGVGILTTTGAGGYGYWYGTSFASPIVAGVAALSFAVNASLTNAEVVAILEKSADDLGVPGYDASFGWGRVNAFQAVSAARQTLSPPLPAAVIEVPPRRPRH